jgi:rod shape-determining protein MreC
MARTRRARRPRLTIGLLVLASITIITLDYRGDGHGAINSLKNGASDAFSPVQRGVDAVTHPVGSFLAGAFNGGQLEQENAKLRSEVSQLQQQTLSERASQNAVKSIEALNHLTWYPNIPTVTAQVISQNPSNFAATVEIDRGTATGVEVGMPVVGGGGLVGSVISTSSSTATVQLITDFGSQVGVTFGSSSGNEAQVNGEGIGKSLTVSYILPGTALRKGEILTTSGLPDLNFPPLIPVAKVTRSASNASSTAETVTAVPTADLAQLSYVDVLQWQPAS